MAGARGRGGDGARGAWASGSLGAPRLGGAPATWPYHTRRGLSPILCPGYRGGFGGPCAQRILSSGVSESLEISSSAGASCELAYLPAHQATPTFVVGNNSGLWASVYVSDGRSVGTAASAGAEYPRVYVHPVVCSSCFSDPCPRAWPCCNYFLYLKC